jgi:uncharacterized membrane protein HdeD (DUF308 family)
MVHDLRFFVLMQLRDHVRRRIEVVQNWVSLIHAAFVLAFAAWAFFSPTLTIGFLLYFMVAHSLVMAILELVFARNFRKHPVDRFILGLAAWGSFFLGTVLFLTRHAELETVIRAIGIYTTFFGVMLVVVSLRLHAFRRPPVHLVQPH